MPIPTDLQVQKIIEAVARSVDPARLGRELSGALERADAGPAAAAAVPVAGGARPSSELLGMLVLADLLDESILQARSGDKAFPLRVLLTSLAQALETDTGLSLAGALNVYFRAPMEEEARMRLGVETSRIYYRFCAERGLERDLVTQAAPLLATVLTGELERVRFESADGAKVFDSQVHERTSDSDPASPRILGAASFLCRVSATNMLRVRALVRT